MNEFIEQFLIEGRELIEQATTDLLALEKRPDDAARLDGVFRALHTLKGAAGIVDFDAMARALHAVEDVLSSARNGSGVVTPALVGDCLSSLDQVLQWLDAIEASSEVPSDADPASDAIVARFARVPADPMARADLTARADPRALADDDRSESAWRELLASASGAGVAIRYRPDRGCFFRGEDPLAFMAKVPGLLTLRLVPPVVWPDLDEFDPFVCQLILLGLSAATSDAVASVLRPVIDQVEILEPGSATPGRPSPPSDEILHAQILMLEISEPRGSVGSLASAGRVAANVLRRAGRSIEAVRLGEAQAMALAAGDPAQLIAAIRAVLAGTLIASGSEASMPSAPADAGARIPAVQEIAARTLRVDVNRIDALVRLTGELTVVKNAFAHVGRQAEAGGDLKALASGLKDQNALLDRLVTELQYSVLGIRVLPLRHVFQRFPRLVRDLEGSLGKSMRLVTEGDDTEADKVIVENLFEPLLHVLRNAADHGLEDADERRAAGKSPTGTIWLRAARVGEQVVVTIADDGRGIDVDRVRQIATQRGGADASAGMTEAELVDLIFAPGFSTATRITDVSGRGVGMDVVRTAVERLGGRVGVESRTGQGTSVHFTLPFTMMITRVMTVEAGGQMFGISLDSVVETVRIDRERIMHLGAARAFTLRSRVVPLFDLADAVGIERSPPDTVDLIVVVAAIGADLAGLLVDRLGERMDVMLKPMEGLLSGTRGAAGTALLGDGRVLIVLDLPEILR